jgi:NADH-quinone oxidoreductase subunit G
MPKMQTACTMTATDGMIVRSVTIPGRGGTGLDLEFILVNHPLDCPSATRGASARCKT